MILPYPITTADLLTLLYPQGRLRTSQAYQGVSPHTNWNEFALTEERRQALAGTSSIHRVSDPVVALSLAEHS